MLPKTLKLYLWAVLLFICGALYGANCYESGPYWYVRWCYTGEPCPPYGNYCCGFECSDSTGMFRQDMWYCMAQWLLYARRNVHVVLVLLRKAAEVRVMKTLKYLTGTVVAVSFGFLIGLQIPRVSGQWTRRAGIVTLKITEMASGTTSYQRIAMRQNGTRTTDTWTTDEVGLRRVIEDPLTKRVLHIDPLTKLYYQTPMSDRHRMTLQTQPSCGDCVDAGTVSGLKARKSMLQFKAGRARREEFYAVDYNLAPFQSNSWFDGKLVLTIIPVNVKDGAPPDDLFTLPDGAREVKSSEFAVQGAQARGEPAPAASTLAEQDRLTERRKQAQ